MPTLYFFDNDYSNKVDLLYYDPHLVLIMLLQLIALFFIIFEIEELSLNYRLYSISTLYTLLDLEIISFFNEIT